MRILFLTAYSYPEQTPSSYLGRQRNEAFIAAGHDLIVYAPVPTRGVRMKSVTATKENSGMRLERMGILLSTIST